MSIELITDAEEMVEQDLQVPVDGLLALAHAPPPHVALEPGDICAHPFDDGDAGLTTVELPLPSGSFVSPCSHETCTEYNWESTVRSFAGLDKHERVRAVRCMLLATTAPRGEYNELNATDYILWRRKRQKRISAEAKQRSLIVYSLRGKVLCRQTFASIVGLDEQTIQRHADKVANGTVPICYDGNQLTSRKGKYGIQRLVVSGFLTFYGQTHGLECPRGRGSRDEQPLLMLSSSITKVDVHDRYVSTWNTLLEGVVVQLPGTNRPKGPLSYSVFIRYWQADFPFLRIASNGSDFCDFCTGVKSEIRQMGSGDERLLAFIEMLEKHRQHAATEFSFYRSTQTECSANPSAGTRHFVFDFAEKVLLPKLLKQPGQLLFITGLKFDIFGVSSSNEMLNYIFGLPEGHWPNERTANTVVSMLHYVLQNQSERNLAGSGCEHLVLHADNCSGQNKNRFVLWYLCWRVLLGMDERIDLYFLVAGHTKNVCDGAFGHVKRRLHHRDAHVPADMMQIIDESSVSTRCVPSQKVEWRNWKAHLSAIFVILTSLSVTKYHVFSFKSAKPGYLYARAYSDSTLEEEFCLLRKDRAVDVPLLVNEQRSKSAELLCTVPLELVPCVQQKTRREYLCYNVLQRYYKNDQARSVAYFEDGTQGLPSGA